MKKKIKNLKPIEYDIHLKYRCKCTQEHWLSYEEASEPDFIILCDCKRILKVKPISGLIIKYKVAKKAIPVTQNHTILEENKFNVTTELTTNKDITNNIPENMINTCSNLLVSFGYSKKEAMDIVKDFCSKNSNIEYSNFVKSLLTYIGRI